MGTPSMNIEEGTSRPAKVDYKSNEFSKSRVIIFFIILCLFALAVAGAVVYYLVDSAEDAEPVSEPEKSDGDGKTQSCVGRLDKYKSAAVATDSSYCTKIGQDFLSNEQASTIDSVIATELCLGVVNFQSTGIGGGGFYTIYNAKEKRFYTLDAREVAPLLATKEMYVDNPGKSTVGGLAIAVPGQLAGFRELHSKFGKLSWKDLFQPTIKLCREGIPISQSIVHALDYHNDWIKEHPEMRNIYVDDATGEPYEVGQLVKMEKLANTLEQIAEDGPDAFYKGKLSDTVLDEIKRAGGIISKEDLKNYKAIWRNPVLMDMIVGGEKFTMATMEPPSSGILVEFIIKTMNGLDLKDKPFQSDPINMFHRFMEISQYAYAARSAFGDSKYHDNTETLQNMTSDEYMALVRSYILEDATRPYEWYGGSAEPTSSTGTSHLSMVGNDGMAVSSTSTVNYYFGSKVFGNVTGIAYNNEMDDFSTPGVPNGYGYPPSASNFIVPGKRPMSSMSPIIIVDEKGDVRLVTGSSGGSRIISANAQIASRNLLYKENLKTATDAPRVYDQWLPPTVSYDKGLAEDIVKGLEKKGHELKALPPNNLGAVVQSIEHKDGWWYPYADVRRGGCAGGV